MIGESQVTPVKKQKPLLLHILATTFEYCIIECHPVVQNGQEKVRRYLLTQEKNFQQIVFFPQPEILYFFLFGQVAHQIWPILGQNGHNLVSFLNIVSYNAIQGPKRSGKGEEMSPDSGEKISKIFFLPTTRIFLFFIFFFCGHEAH